MMKTSNGLWKNLGLILVLLGAVALAACFLMHHVNNTVLGSAMGTILVGLIAYILMNKQRKY